jgi:hypothetical protein
MPHWQAQDVDEVKDETAPTITLRPLPAFALQVGLGLTSSIWGREWLIALVTYETVRRAAAPSALTIC